MGLWLGKFGRILRSVAILSLMATCGFASWGVGSSVAAEDTVLLYNNRGESTQVKLPGDRYGIQFRVSEALKQVELYVSKVKASGEPRLTLSLYRWNQNYSDTLRGTPIVTQEFRHVKGSSWVSLSCEGAEAGEYLLLIENGTNGVTLELSASSLDKVQTYWNASKRRGSLRARVQLQDAGSLEAITPGAVSTFVTFPDTWAVTDGLNREVPISYTDTRREGKQVGIFFHTWHSPNMHVNNGFLDTNQILQKYPDIPINDYQDSRWGNAATYFWNEPIWGYYRTSDEWVLRRQAELLADAQIDVVFFDCTNGHELFLDDALTLLQVWSEARADGVKTPAVSFQLNMFDFSEAAIQLRTLYEKIYEPGLYEELWYYWKGKPLVLAYPGSLSTAQSPDREIRDFFQYRVISHKQSQDGVQVQDSVTGAPLVRGDNSLFTDNGYSVWNWIAAYPQIINQNPDGTAEEMAVSVSHNWSKEGHLTAFSNQKDTVFSRDYMPVEDRYDTRENAKLYGAYFQAQWERALEVDPEFIFITGWNEWTAGRYEEYWGVTNAIIDNFTDNRSRDIEPSKGDLKDHYYYQMVSYIRQFKGMSAVPVVQEQHTIDLDASEDLWSEVSPSYESYPGDTENRASNGYKDIRTGRFLRYEDETGRNDIVRTKLAYDDDFVTFMVETAEDLTSYQDPAWMRLLIEVVSANGEGIKLANWESFQYIVNRTTPESETVTTLEASTGGWNWQTVGKVSYRCSGNRLEIQIPRAFLGIEEGDFTLNFKWSDNMQTDGDVMDFYTHGDVAPGGRYKYQFVAGAPMLPPATEEDPEHAFGKIWPWVLGAGLLCLVGAGWSAAVVQKRRKRRT